MRLLVDLFHMVKALAELREKMRTNGPLKCLRCRHWKDGCTNTVLCEGCSKYEPRTGD